MNSRIAATLLAAVAVSVSGCGGATPAASSPPPIANVAAPSASAAAIDATPRHYRLVLTGMLPAPSRRTTYELVIDGKRATLRETQEHADPSPVVLDGTDAHASWAFDGMLLFSGTARRTSTAIELDVAANRKLRAPIHLTCAVTSIAGVHAVDARLGPHVPRAPDYECGDTGTWSPATTSTVEVLACAGMPELGPASEGAPAELLFAAGDGLEWAFRNDDCNVQGGGLRFAR